MNLKVQMEDKNSNISNIITSFKFAELANVIFSGVFLKSQLNELNLLDDISDHVGDKEYFFVRKKEFKLKENDIIFCKTEYVKELFYILKKQCKFKNIKLITHQSDLAINNNLYKSKPKCISEWYSVNVNVIKSDLIPIPIGIANFHSKNLDSKFFSSRLNINKYFSLKKNYLYLNFNPNTKFSERKGLLEFFKDRDWAKVDVEMISHHDYKENIENHKFVLSPWGNGIDTHRFWEALYSGSIPVTKKHYIYESLKTLPILQIDNYFSITEDRLKLEYENFYQNKKSYNLSELDFDYWKLKILKNVVEGNSTKEIHIINNMSSFRKSLPDIKHTFKSKFKKLNRIRRYIYKKIKL